MNILAFDTCFSMCSAAVATGADGPAPCVTSLAEPMATGHAERLMPMIGEVLAQAGIEAKQLDRIAVANGPGTFTGTRIAVSAARALALATGARIVALSSLEAMAHHHAIGPLEPGHVLAVAMNANRGEVYIQCFDGNSRSAKSPPQLLTVRDAVALIGEYPVTVVGSGADLIAEMAAEIGTDVRAELAGLLPCSSDIVVLAARLLPLAEPLRPLYLRAPDARPQDGKSLARAP